MRLTVLTFVFLLAACATPAPVLEPPPPPPVEEAPAFSAAVTRDGKVQGTGLMVGEIQATFAGGADGAVLFVGAGADSTRLFRLDGSGLAQVHAVAGSAVYTAVWSPDGDLASFGHYKPAGNASPGRPAMGAGDIFVLDGSETARVGCSASRAVLAWAPNGQLLVRNTNNLYVVTRDGCDTAATVDARRMHGLTVSPDAARLAFVHRELEYNRATRAYEPDSTFRLTDLDGGNPKTIVSFRYHPKRLAWRPDGAELAFDATATEEAGRAISIFDVASGTTAFLHPPATDRDEFGPVWAPDGAKIAYLRGDEGGDFSVWVRSFATTFPEGLPESDGSKIIGWVDGTAVAYQRPNGEVAAYDLASRETTELGSADAVIRVVRHH